MRVKRKVHKSYLSPVGERGGKIFSLRRQCLYCPIVRIFFRTSSRLAKIRLHFRTNCVRFLLLIYISDPDGECLDIDDLRSVCGKSLWMLYEMQQAHQKHTPITKSILQTHIKA